MKSNPDRQLTCVRSLELAPIAPFHFDSTFHKPSHFPSSDCSWEPSRFWMTRRWVGQPVGLKLQDVGTVQQPRVSISVFSAQPLSDRSLQTLVDNLAFDYDLFADLKPFYSYVECDTLMQPVLERWKGMRVSGAPLYESLIVYIVLQNATVRRSVQMLENLFDAFGDAVEFEGRLLSSFWDPQVLAAVEEDSLRRLKVGYRARSLLRVSSQLITGFPNESYLRSLSDEDLRQELLRLYGIGPASVGYLLFEVFHRYGCFNQVSPWEQRIYSRLLFQQELVPAQRILMEVDQRWGPWKMLAAHYLFEDLFWLRRHEPVEWLENLIRL